ncbi:ras-related protein Rab-23 [Platysternon megacephalum]|uniref:Ras-related protein Rab-23 n=1 Tax=Platysternon megacephalum TaxID=55544 RepID=A0A4D9E2J7_9SAUR|nr:ras-related protein Rab-23 [Platysternon megacephalum]
MRPGRGWGRNWLAAAAAAAGGVRAARPAGDGEHGPAAAPADRHRPPEDEAAHGARPRLLRGLCMGQLYQHEQVYPRQRGSES